MKDEDEAKRRGDQGFSILLFKTLALLLLTITTGYCKQSVLIASFSSMDTSITKPSVDIVHVLIARDTNYNLIRLQTSRPEAVNPSDSAIPDSTALTIGEHFGANYVVMGSVSILLGDTTLALKLLSVDSGTIVNISITSIQEGHYESYRHMLVSSILALIKRKRWTRASRGIGLTFGFGGTFYDSKTSSFLGNHGGANAQLDILGGPVALKLKGSVWTINLEKDAYFSGIGYTHGDKINPATGTIAIGWIKPLADGIYTTPYAGFSTFSLNYIDKDDAKKKSLPTAYGFSIGNSVDYVFYTSSPNDFLGCTVRFDAGISIIDKQAISKFLGDELYFFSITVGAFGYGSKLQ